MSTAAERMETVSSMEENDMEARKIDGRNISKERKMMAIRGYLDEAGGGRSAKEIFERIGGSQSNLCYLLKTAQDIGAIRVREKADHVTYYESAPGLPYGWTENDPAEALALHKREPTEPKAKRTVDIPAKKGRSTIAGGADCAMAKALRMMKPVDASTTWQYKALYDLVNQMPEVNPAGTRGLNGEMQDILKELRKFLEYRMHNVKSECPFCGGELVKDNGAYCTKCRKRVNVGTFEESVKAMKVLAKIEERRSA